MKNIKGKLKLMMLLSEMLGRDPMEELANVIQGKPFKGSETLPQEDHSPKEIGDRVRLLDQVVINYFHDYETKKQLGQGTDIVHEQNKDLFENDAIVVNPDIRYEFNCGHCENIHRHDMIVMYPHNKKKYYVTARDFSIAPTI